MGKLLKFPVLPRNESCQCCGMNLDVPDDWDNSFEVICLRCHLWYLKVLGDNIMKELE